MPTRPTLRFLLSLAFAASLTSAAFADNKAVLGRWEITIDDDGWEESDLDITLEIEEDDDGQLTGTWSSSRGDDYLEDVEWDGKTLTFVRYFDFGFREVEVECSADVSGNTLEGEMEMPRRVIDFSGKRGR